MKCFVRKKDAWPVEDYGIREDKGMKYETKNKGVTTNFMSRYYYGCF